MDDSTQGVVGTIMWVVLAAVLHAWLSPFLAVPLALAITVVALSPFAKP